MKKSNKSLAKNIDKKRENLKAVRKELKDHFVGIDHIIDNVISDMEAWYIMPELLNRPVIINLWGLTGVGKTDLVRRLTKAIDFQDRYCEIDMSDNSKNDDYDRAKTIGEILSNNFRIESGEPCIILVDEFQKFRSKDEDGNEMELDRFHDIWQLLSDGELPFTPDMSFLYHERYDLEDSIKRDITRESSGKKKKPHEDDTPYRWKDWNLYEVETFKSKLRRTEPIEELAKLSKSQRLKIIEAAIRSKSKMYSNEDYTKCLIFISGNIDEAYPFSESAEEVDVDADLFYNESMKINMLDIKRALKQRFRMEQIARLGNNHVVYPALSRNSYEKIIERKTDSIIEKVESNFKIKIKMDKSVNKLVYNNGVFPTQGTRPVFSTISQVLEAQIPKFLLNPLLEGSKKISVFYDYDKKEFIVERRGGSEKFPYSGSIDELKVEKGNNKDQRASVSVHEAGHAIVYAELFKLSPNQLVSNPAASDTGGFIYSHSPCGSKKSLQDKICVLLAGNVAEEIVFGADFCRNGNSNDLMQATKTLGLMIKEYGMEAFDVQFSKADYFMNTNVKEADDEMNPIMVEIRRKASKIINDKKDLLIDVVDRFMEQESISPEEFQEICKKHGMDIGIQNSEELIFHDYYERFKDFKTAKRKAAKK
jgi:cell division protease FtsH